MIWVYPYVLPFPTLAFRILTIKPRQYFPLPVEDYLLGLSDLTGELMRYAISAISQRGGRSKANEVCVFVRNCKAGEYVRFWCCFDDTDADVAQILRCLRLISGS